MNLNSTNITAVIAIAAIISPVLVQIIKSLFDYQLRKKEFKLKQSISDEKKSKRNHRIAKQYHDQYEQTLLSFVSAVNECAVLYSNSSSITDRFIKRREAVNLGLKLLPYLQSQDQKIILAIVDQLDQHDPSFNDIYTQSKKINSEVLRLLNKQ